MKIYDIHENVIYNGEQINAGFLNTAYMRLLKTISAGTVQGACTDGTYIYYIIISLNELHKYNIFTGEDTYITYTSGLYNHANDMTYNPNTEKIYIATMQTNDSLRIVNPSTLADEGAISLKNGNGTIISVSGIAYNRDTNSYIASSGSNYYFYDSGFNYVSTRTYDHGSEWTYQGLECDGNYIFRPIWQTGANAVDILTHSCVYVGQIELPNNTEVETLINNWDGVWYTNFNTPGAGGGLYFLGLYQNIDYADADALARIAAGE